MRTGDNLDHEEFHRVYCSECQLSLGRREHRVVFSDKVFHERCWDTARRRGRLAASFPGEATPPEGVGKTERG